jgi:hypothetical protein
VIADHSQPCCEIEKTIHEEETSDADLAESMADLKVCHVSLIEKETVCLQKCSSRQNSRLNMLPSEMHI